MTSSENGLKASRDNIKQFVVVVMDKFLVITFVLNSLSSTMFYRYVVYTIQQILVISLVFAKSPLMKLS